PGLLRPIHANLASYASPTPSPIRVPLRVRGCAVSNVHWLDATLGSRPQSSCLRILLMHLADVLPHIHVPGASARPLDRGDRAARQPVHEGGDLHGKMPPSIVTARLDGGSESVTSDNGRGTRTFPQIEHCSVISLIHRSRQRTFWPGLSWI